VTPNINRCGNYFRSVVVTGLVTFCLPLLLIGGTFLGLLIVQLLTPLMPVSQQGMTHLLDFLAILGNGDPWQGGLVMGLCSSFVGILFDTYTFYHLSMWRR
jgi:hypothetical protein